MDLHLLSARGVPRLRKDASPSVPLSLLSTRPPTAENREIATCRGEIKFHLTNEKIVAANRELLRAQAFDPPLPFKMPLTSRNARRPLSVCRSPSVRRGVILNKTSLNKQAKLDLLLSPQKLRGGGLTRSSLSFNTFIKQFP